MRTRFSFRRRENDDVQVDMTPMLDIVFIMLIFFVVSSSFLQIRSLAVQLPAAQSAQRQQSEPLHLQLLGNGQLRWQGQPLQAHELGEVLAQLPPHTKVLIEADSQVPHGQVVALMDKIRQAGIQQLAVGVLPQ
ncbi:biopolymer transporter ExbD [Pseudaeromonas paramecii]|uniref:Biopolymer transporter ExbD n=1 Tax=Pseudaeromonas paramecii TaxID=2138166 RepID=A0ABP8QGM4_9GAMM